MNTCRALMYTLFKGLANIVRKAHTQSINKMETKITIQIIKLRVTLRRAKSKIYETVIKLSKRSREDLN